MAIILYLFIFSALGWSLQQMFSSPNKTNWQKQWGESFFVGIVMVICIENTAQLFHLNLNQALLFKLVFIYAVFSAVLFVILNKHKLKKPTFYHNNGFLLLTIFLIVVHLFSLIYQNHLLPITPWDAWNGWLAKGKIWYFNGINELIVVRPQWLEHNHAYTNATAHYPDGLPLLYVFNAGFWGWQETSLNAIYPAMFMAFLLAFYGNIKLLTSAVCAQVASVLLISLPLLAAHVALAGYADIWMAAFLFLSFINLVRIGLAKDRANNRHILFTFFIFTFGLLSFKLIAWVWCFILIGTYAVFKIPKDKRLKVYAIIAVVFIMWYVLHGISITTPWGLLSIQPDVIQVPGLGIYKLKFLDSTQSWLEALFYSNNWHLLWFSLPFVLYFAFKQRAVASVRFTSIFLFLSIVFLFVLFYMTYNSVFANDFTSSNRIVLHVVPVYLFFLVQLGYRKNM